MSGQGLKRVILLSDGQANEGLTDTEELAAQCADWAARAITTGTCGLVRRFNEDLMVATGRAGGGNPCYGDTADDQMEPFEQELELLGNLCLRDPWLAATEPDGSAVEIVNRLPKTNTGWRLPDLAWGAEPLMGMRDAAAASDRARVDTLLAAASRQSAGKPWVAAVLEAMRSIAAGREREQAMKEMLYSSSKLRGRLASKDESLACCQDGGSSVPADLRRKPAQGKGDIQESAPPAAQPACGACLGIRGSAGIRIHISR